MLFRNTMTEELNRVQYQEMIYNFAPLDEEIIKTRMDFVKQNRKYPITSFINSVFISDSDIKSIEELKIYYKELVEIISSSLPLEEQYNNEEKELIIHYMILYYYQHSSSLEENHLEAIRTFSKDFYKYLDYSFNNEIFEYIKEELLYQLMIFEGQNVESYKNGDLSKILTYLNSISEKHNNFNPDATLEVEG